MTFLQNLEDFNMNFDNLKKLADFVSTIPQENFNMRILRDSQDSGSKHCNSVGCIMGHMTAIIPDSEIVYFLKTQEIDFYQTASKWLNLSTTNSKDDGIFQFIFHFLWSNVDNTVQGAVNRIKYLIKYKQLPDNWKDQLSGRSPITYNENY